MIHALELKLWHFEVLHMFVQEAMHLQCLPIKKITGMHAGYVNDPLLNTVCGYLDACLHCVALLRIQFDYKVVFGQFFFLLSVWYP